LKFPIETIIFDLDGTLRHNVPSADDVSYNFALQMGVSDLPGRQRKGTRWSHYYWAQSDELLKDITEFGNGIEDGFWRNYAYRYLKALGVPDDQAQDWAGPLWQFIDTEFNPENRLHPCVPEMLTTLKGAGYQLGLVSNRTNSCHEECENLGLLAYLDFAYVAGEVDAWKPDPRIFDRAIEITGSPPERIVYVGDNYYADMVGAKSAGLQPVLLDPKSTFPEVECLVIAVLDELMDILQKG